MRCLCNLFTFSLDYKYKGRRAMKNISKLMLAVLLTLILVGWASLSEAWLGNLQQGRCESTNRLVKLGDHYSQVILECGEPDAVTVVGYTTTSLASGSGTSKV